MAIAMMPGVITFDEAVQALMDSLGDSVIWQQPAHGLSKIVMSARPTWVLCNVNGLIAKVDAISGTIHSQFLEV